MMISHKQFNMKLIIKEELDRSSIFSFLKAYFDHYSPATYDPDEDDMQCSMNKARGVEDLHALCLSYFPDCTLVDVIDVLVTLMNSDDKYRAIQCTTTKQITFYNATKKYDCYNFYRKNFDSYDEDEKTSWRYPTYKVTGQKYSFCDLLDLSSVKYKYDTRDSSSKKVEKPERTETEKTTGET